MLNVEQAIAEVANVYQSLTGKPIKPGRSDFPQDLPPEEDPVAHVERRYRQFQRLFEGNKQGRMPAESGVWFSPATDVVEIDREVRIYIDMPGVTRDHLSVLVAGEVLVVRGERPEKKADAAMIRYKERWGGAFQKNIALPPRVRREGIEATLRDGVLTITIPTDGSGNEVAELPIDVKS